MPTHEVALLLRQTFTDTRCRNETITYTHSLSHVHTHTHTHAHVRLITYSTRIQCQKTKYNRFLKQRNLPNLHCSVSSTIAYTEILNFILKTKIRHIFCETHNSPENFDCMCVCVCARV